MELTALSLSTEACIDPESFRAGPRISARVGVYAFPLPPNPSPSPFLSPACAFPFFCLSALLKQAQGREQPPNESKNVFPISVASQAALCLGQYMQPVRLAGTRET
jgi:hypothetical protein